MVEAPGLEENHVMQGMYFRAGTKKPWVLVRRTRSVADAEYLARRVAAREKRGRLLYVEAPGLLSDIWDMRAFLHRKLGGWLAKALLPGFKKIRQSGKIAWKKHDVKQLSLFG